MIIICGQDDANKNNWVLKTISCYTLTWSDLCNCSFTYVRTPLNEVVRNWWSTLFLWWSRVSNHEAFSIIQTIKQLIESRRIITPQQDSMPSQCTNPLASLMSPYALNLSSPLLPFHPDSKYKKLLTLYVGASIMQLLNKSTRAEIIKKD